MSSTLMLLLIRLFPHSVLLCSLSEGNVNLFIEKSSIFAYKVVMCQDKFCMHSLLQSLLCGQRADTLYVRKLESRNDRFRKIGTLDKGIFSYNTYHNCYMFKEEKLLFKIIQCETINF